jgi:hypothetical protein
MRKSTNSRVPAGALLRLVLAFACGPQAISNACAEDVPGASFEGAAEALSGAIPATDPAPAPAPPMPEAAQAPPRGAPIILGRKPDYYAKRAIETVKQDERAADRGPHPLAAKYPEFSVVVCEGGCNRERGPEIVYLARRPKTEIVIENAMVPSSSSPAGPAPATPGSSARWIDCLAGCYDTPKRYAAPVALKQTRVIETAPAAPAKPAVKAREPFSPIR